MPTDTELKKRGARRRRGKTMQYRIDRNVYPEPNTGCWIWAGGCDRDGYGIITTDTTKQNRAHRLIYEYLAGPIPFGLVLDHLCRNPWCVNPSHLEPVTSLENLRRGNPANFKGKTKSTCKKGHSWTKENTIYRSGHRRCKICAAVTDTKWHNDHKHMRRKAYRIAHGLSWPQWSKKNPNGEPNEPLKR